MPPHKNDSSITVNRKKFGITLRTKDGLLIDDNINELEANTLSPISENEVQLWEKDIENGILKVVTTEQEVQGNKILIQYEYTVTAEQIENDEK
uniref:Uncharacterized protein n=1 Tax=Panagrolaimus sp. ES5 TaxID=591445 RepID=A0AC34F4R0_9BILA